jgi:hypothetical protein
MKGYEKRFEKVTGEKWKGKVINRPERSKGCMIGGSILFTSHNCADVRRSSLIKYGVMDKISLSWMRERINIVSTYKPYPNKAKGSLLSAVTEGGECFEDRYWETLIGGAGNGKMIIGGDFNLKCYEIDERIGESGLIREQFHKGSYTFKSDIEEEQRGRTIDHILSRGHQCSA